MVKLINIYPDLMCFKKYCCWYIVLTFQYTKNDMYTLGFIVVNVTCVRFLIKCISYIVQTICINLYLLVYYVHCI